MVTQPPRALELNLVEIVWHHLRANKLTNSLYQNCQHIVDACFKAWNDFMANPAQIASFTSQDWA